MFYGDRLIGTETMGVWTMNFFEVQSEDGAYLCTSVELERQDVRKCRLTLVRPNVSTDLVKAQLRAKAMEWVEQWAQRSHSGATGFENTGR